MEPFTSIEDQLDSYGDKSMSNLNFLHSGGNKVTLSAPASNPSSDITFKLPQPTGVLANF